MPTDTNDPTSLSFEEALLELEQILRELEDGTISLEAALARYERGILLVRCCYQRLQHAQQKIRLLSGLDGEGNPQFQPFEHTPTIESVQSSHKNPIGVNNKEP